MIDLLTLLVTSCATIEETDRVAPEELDRIKSSYERLASESTGTRFSLTGCDASCSECAKLRILGAATRIRITGEKGPSFASADLVRPLNDSLEPTLRPLVWTLHPEPKAPDVAITGVSTPSAPVPVPVWILGGAAVVAFGVGTGFGISSASARSDLEDGTAGSQETLELAGRMDDHARMANIFFVSGVVAALGAVAWWVIEGST